MTFRFPFEALLKTRRIAEQHVQREVAVIERERLRLEQALRGQQQGIREAKHALRDHLTGTLHAPELRMQADTTMRSMRTAQRLAIELAGIYRRLEEARGRLARATAARRAIELLRERRLAAYRARLDRLEQAALDDLAGAAAAREETRP